MMDIYIIKIKILRYFIYYLFFFDRMLIFKCKLFFFLKNGCKRKFLVIIFLKFYYLFDNDIINLGFFIKLVFFIFLLIELIIVNLVNLNRVNRVKNIKVLRCVLEFFCSFVNNFYIFNNNGIEDNYK